MEDHGPPPSKRQVLASAGLLAVSPVAVVGLAKALSPAMEARIAWAGAPKAVIGVVIAALVLLPEAVASVRAARGNRLQTSLELGARLGAGQHRVDDSRRGDGYPLDWESR